MFEIWVLKFNENRLWLKNVLNFKNINTPFFQIKFGKI